MFSLHISKLQRVTPAFVLCLLLLLIGCQQSWAEYVAPEQEFTVLFPGQPKENIQTLDIGGASAEVHQYVIENSQTGDYIVQKIVYPTEFVTQIGAITLFDRLQASLAARVQGTLVSAKTEVIDGHDERSLEISLPGADGAIRARLLLYSNQLYMVMHLGNNKNSSSANTTQFLASLKIKNP